MPHVIGENRNQIMMISLESMIRPESFVRAIDAFVDSIDMESFGFAHAKNEKDGRPSYHPSVLMKLYLYGYHHGIRSSRKLEREAATNLEAMWLTYCQTPKYKTIANFRKDHSTVFRSVFRRFVSLLKDWDLVDGSCVAIDSFKIRAQNSLKNNLNADKIDRHIEYIEGKIAEYENILDKSDGQDEQKEIYDKIDVQKSRRTGYETLKEELEKTGEEQISLTDPDARSVVLHRNIVNVGYNVQAACDSKHKMLVEYDAGSVNDSHALASMAVAVKELLGNGSMDVLADKGYHTGQELGKLETETITSYVSPKEPSNPPNDLFPVSRFEYDVKKDEYTCPAGETLSTNNVWHSHSGKGRKPAFRFKRYTTSACKNCRLRERCTAGKRNGRAIDRSEYADAIEANGRRVKERPEYYKLRQQITEHQFGTLKRQRGFTYTLLKGKEKVLGEVGIMMMAYDLSRCAAILKTAGFLRALEKTRSCPKKPCFKADNGSLWALFYNEKIVTKKYLPEKCSRKTEKFNHKQLFLSLEAA